MTALSLADVDRLARRGNVVPLSLELSSDLLTPVSAWLRLARAGARGFLLESVEGGQRLARYSFLGVDPIERLVVEDGELHVEDLRQVAPRSSPPPRGGSPLAHLRDHLARYRGVARPELPPFTGGAVGYLGYECARYLERLPAPAQRRHAHDAQLLVFPSVVAFDHVRQRVVLMSNVLADEAPTLRAAHDAALDGLDALRARLALPAEAEEPLVLPAEEPGDPPLPGARSALGEAAFGAGVARIQEHIRAGDIFQCVLSDQTSFPLASAPFDVYRALRTVSPAPYLFHLALGDEVLLGASPEMLVRVSDRRVETSPIAGTRPRGRTPAEDARLERQLRASRKERAEHVMLVDLGRNDVGRVAAPGTVVVRELLSVERFSHVMHLVSLVEGRLARGRTAFDALFSCFPAGTLSGAPKIRAMEIIAGLETVQRGPYGGAVVYADFSGRLDSCIAIRSLYARGGTGFVQAGAGVVADSRADREYDEVRNKTRALRRALALARQGRA